MAWTTRFEETVSVNIACAIATHIWYRYHEPTSIMSVLITLTIVPSTLVAMVYSRFPSVPSAIGFVYALYLISLLTSIAVYRLSPLHPLAKYPGPVLCKLTKLWSVYISYGGQLHRYYKALHHQYGPIVRVGPNELSIIDKDAIPFILGPHGMAKGPLWDGRIITSSQYRNRGLINIRNLEAHAKLRKPWNKAFGPSALKDYEEILKTSAQQFIEHLESLCRSQDVSVSTNMGELIGRFTFDIMGDITFDHSFGLVASGDPDGLLAKVAEGLILPSLSQHIPWFARVLKDLPFVGSDTRAFGAFASKQAQNRASRIPQRKDVIHHLVDATIPGSDHSASTVFPIIIGIAILIIAAGSDTTATTLSGIVFNLTRYPQYHARLRKEIDEAFAGTAHVDLGLLAGLPFLNAVINEVLRLAPPIPTSLQRAPEVGSGGHFIGKMFIPEGTAVNIPSYTLHRDPKYFFPHPDKFWPERWLADQSDHGILERSAFIPFSFGPANCVGKAFAMSEMRLVIALLVTKFDMAFPQGYDPARWDNELEDRLLFTRGDLPVVLTVREPHM